MTEGGDDEPRLRDGETEGSRHSIVEPGRLRRAVLVVAGLNFAYFWVEVAVALAIGSVALFADSVDFLEDAAVNVLIFLALGWPLARRALAGKVMALVILIPALAAAWQAFSKVGNPEPPDPLLLAITAGGAMVVNGICAWVLWKLRHDGGSMSTAAFLAARNDVLINLAIILVAAVTVWTSSGWPDILLGAVIIVLNVTAAREVWEVATEERLAAKALAGEDLD